MALTKNTVSRVVHISMDAEGNITHAWQDSSYAILEDDIEISRHNAAAENLEPETIEKIIPDRAELLGQITKLQADAVVADDLKNKIGRLQEQLSKQAKG